MKPCGIALTLLLIVFFPYGAHAQVTGMVDFSMGWLSLPMSDLNVLLHAYNYPGISEHFLSFGLYTILGVPNSPLRLGIGGKLALALPGPSLPGESEATFVFLYGGMVTEFTRSITTIGQVSLGSLFGIGGAFLDLERSRQDITTFDRALDELVRASGEFARGYWVAQPYLRVSVSIPKLLEKLDIQLPRGERVLRRPVNPNLSFTVGYVYAFPWSGWVINNDDSEGRSWPGPLDRLSGPVMTLSLSLDISSLEHPYVVIDSIRFRGDDEVVTLVNLGRKEADLSGWQIISSTVEREQIAQIFVFPQGCIVPRGGRVRVHSGPATIGKTSTPCGQAEIDLYNRYAGIETDGAEVWDDRADLARLQDAYGEKIDTCSYKAKPELDATECHK